MRTTTLLTATGLLLLAGPARTLAQSLPSDPVLNAETPFIRNLRPDRPGQTITTNMLRPGQVQVELGTLRYTPPYGLGPRRTLSSALLRVGFFNHIELRATQGYLADISARPTLGDAPLPTLPSYPSGFAPLTVGAKFLASTNQDSRSQVVLLTELTLPTGNASYPNQTYEPAARLLVSQQLGQRYGLEANVGFRQRGFRAEGTSQGQYLGTLALNGAILPTVGFFAETYTFWQRTYGWQPGLTGGLYWRPLPGLRLDLNTGNTWREGRPAPQVGAGLSIRLPK